MKKRPPEKRPLLARLKVGVVIAGFFAILPLAVLSTREGWLRFRCGGSPWTCTITHARLLSTRSEQFTPTAIDFSRDSHVGPRGRTVRHWELLFTLGGKPTPVLTGDDAGGPIKAVARELEAARIGGAPIERELPPDGGFWLMVVVTAIFAGAGLFIGLST